MAKRENNGVTPSSGNVFADLGLTNAEELGTKLRLCFVINKILAERKFTQAKAARILGVNQPKISALSNYRLGGFSVERMMHFLNAPGRNVEIVIRNKPGSRRPARIFVAAA